MKMKFCLFFLPLVLLALLAGCGAPPAAEEAVSSPAGPVFLDLNGADDSGLTVTEPGTYRVAGVTRGRLTVDASGPVELLLDGVGLTGPNCLQVLSKYPVTITTAPGSDNVLSDGAMTADDAASAVVTSAAPLAFGGDGSLTIIAGADHAVRCRKDVLVSGGSLKVSAANAGFKVSGNMTVSGGELTIRSGGDGIAAENGRLADGDVALTGGAVRIEAEGRGIDAESGVALTGGRSDIRAGLDGIRADVFRMDDGDLTLETEGDGIQTLTALEVRGGLLGLVTGGGGGDAISHPGESFGPWGSSSSSADTVSAKGLKSDGVITLSGGVIDISSADDSIHCETVFTMEDGDVAICSGDDAIHAGDMLVVNGGTVNITDCFEGLEAFAVEVRGGDITIRAVNDGINANGPEGMFGRETQEDFESVSGAATTYFLMAGGRVDLAVTGTMSNMGDGVDSNGAVYITGGELIVSTYGSFMENGLDTGWGGPVVTGGMVIAGGSSTMAEGFSSSSTQCCATISTSYMPDGTRVTITDEDGGEIWSVTLADGFSCLQLSHPGLTQGHVYTLTFGEQSVVLDFTETTNISNARGFGGFRPF